MANTFQVRLRCLCSCPTLPKPLVLWLMLDNDSAQTCSPGLVCTVPCPEVGLMSRLTKKRALPVIVGLRCVPLGSCNGGHKVCTSGLLWAAPSSPAPWHWMPTAPSPPHWSEACWVWCRAPADPGGPEHTQSLRRDRNTRLSVKPLTPVNQTTHACHSNITRLTIKIHVKYEERPYHSPVWGETTIYACQSNNTCLSIKIHSKYNERPQYTPVNQITHACQSKYTQSMMRDHNICLSITTSINCQSYYTQGLRREDTKPVSK